MILSRRFPNFLRVKRSVFSVILLCPIAVTSLVNAAAVFPETSGGFSALPSQRNGFSGQPISTVPGDFGDKVLDGLSLSTTLSGTYDTNPSQGYSTPSSSGEGDFFMTLGAGLNYRTKASRLTFGVNYNGSYSEYFKQSNLSGYNQSAGLSADYENGALSAIFNVGFNFGSGANRYYAAVVDELQTSYGVSVRYRVSPKTSLTGNASWSSTSASGAGDSDTSSFILGTSALWRYSPLTEFGPGIRYTSQSGGGNQDRSSIGPTVSVNYQLSKKISLNSVVGLDFAKYDNGGSADPTVSASASLNYRASKLWGMSLSLNRDVEADPSGIGGFDETTSLRVGYNRKILRATLNLGASYETVASNSSGSTTVARPDRDYLSLDSSLGMQVFGNTCNASIFMRYIDQSGGSKGDSFDSTQLGFQISRNF